MEWRSFEPLIAWSKNDKGAVTGLVIDKGRGSTLRPADSYPGFAGYW